MNILFDARYVTQKFSGIGYYTYHLLSALSKLNLNNTLEYIVCKDKQKKRIDIQTETTKAYQTIVNFESHPLFEVHANTIIPYKLYKEKIDIFHGPAIFIPFIKHKNYKLIATIHDLVAFLYPQTVPKKYLPYLKFMTKQAIKKADHLIAASHNTKKDIMELFKVPESKISVTHYAADTIFFNPPSDTLKATISKKIKLPEQFILSVGNLEPRKNLKNLIKAFTQLKKDFAPAKNLKLVLVGNKGWLYDDIFQEANTIRDDILFTGYLSTEELSTLYHLADFLVFPSLYEGFGLPLLEAMAAGIPIAASNTSSIPEIVEDAAFLFDPTNLQKIVDGLVTLLENNKLKEELRKKGQLRIKQFSWEKTAKETIAIYQKTMET